MAETATVERVAAQLQGFVDQVQDSELGSPTPCTDWDVRALLNHVTGGGILFGACIREGACPDDLLTALMTEDQVGDDPSASFRASAQTFLDAAAGADPDRVVTTPWGEMPVSLVMDIAAADLTIHTVDLAVAIDADLDGFDGELLATADGLAHKYFPADGRGAEFAAPTTASADAHPAIQLAAFAGRAV